MPSNYCILEMHITNFIFQKMYSQITSVDTHARAPRGGFFTGYLRFPTPCQPSSAPRSEVSIRKVFMIFSISNEFIKISPFL